MAGCVGADLVVVCRPRLPDAVGPVADVLDVLVGGGCAGDIGDGDLVAEG